MWGNLPLKYKRKLNVIVFLFLPILFVIGFFLSTWTVKQLNYPIDRKGLLIVSISLIPLYLICVKTIYKKIREKSNMENANAK
jgi:hypothetical protein